MRQITVRLPYAVIEALDAAASRLKRSRAEIVRPAIERYLEDFDDLSVAVERLRDPNDPVLDWDQVRSELLHQDWAKRGPGDRACPAARARAARRGNRDRLAQHPFSGNALKGGLRGLQCLRVGTFGCCTKWRKTR